MEWVFQLYDFHKNGFFTKPDLLRVIKAIYDMMGENSEPPVTEDDVSEHVRDIFKVT